MAGGTTRVSRHFGGTEPKKCEKVEGKGGQRGISREQWRKGQGAATHVAVVAKTFITKFEHSVVHGPRVLGGSMH